MEQEKFLQGKIARSNPDLCPSAVDMINHPPHYNMGGIEVIEMIKVATAEGYPDYLLGNILKYLYRYKHKNGVEDLKKAVTYLNWLIKEVEK